MQATHIRPPGPFDSGRNETGPSRCNRAPSGARWDRAPLHLSRCSSNPIAGSNARFQRPSPRAGHTSRRETIPYEAIKRLQTPMLPCPYDLPCPRPVSVPVLQDGLKGCTVKSRSSEMINFNKVSNRSRSSVKFRKMPCQRSDLQARQISGGDPQSSSILGVTARQRVGAACGSSYCRHLPRLGMHGLARTHRWPRPLLRDRYTAMRMCLRGITDFTAWH